MIWNKKLHFNYLDKFAICIFSNGVCHAFSCIISPLSTKMTTKIKCAHDCHDLCVKRWIKYLGDRQIDDSLYKLSLCVKQTTVVYTVVFALRACTTAVFLLSLCCKFYRKPPVRVKRRSRRRLTKGRRGLVLPGRIGGTQHRCTRGSCSWGRKSISCALRRQDLAWPHATFNPQSTCEAWCHRARESPPCPASSLLHCPVRSLRPPFNLAVCCCSSAGRWLLSTLLVPRKLAVTARPLAAHD
jgi:hypothetical protein